MKSYFMPGFILTIILISGCVQRIEINNCEELGKQLDSYIDNEYLRVEMSECDNWNEAYNPIIIGGTLINKENRGFVTSRNHYEWDLTFRGFKKEGKLGLVTYTNETLPYQTGQFYRFDLGNYCRTIMSAALSGAFVDRDLDKLELLDCQSST